MDYEQKYKEALEKARQFSEHPLQEDSSSIVEYIFPELADSEDERIRKALIRFHKSTIDVDGIKGEDIIAWLEKQGEQNPYSGISFKHKGHTWVMRARDYGADLIRDGKLQASFGSDRDAF